MKLDAQRGRHLENGRQAGVPSPDVNCSDVHEALLGSGQSRRASGHHNALLRIHIEPSFHGCKGG